MPRGEGSRVFVGNITTRTHERDFERFFDKYGRVRNIFVRPGRYGFCEFDDYRDADDAVRDLDGRDLNGARVTVEHAREPAVIVLEGIAGVAVGAAPGWTSTEPHRGPSTE